MSLSYNGTEIQGITWNGAEVQSVTMDGVEVWSGRPEILFKLEYDSSQATHVKVAKGKGSTSLGANSAAPTAAADPFGGNNALDFVNNNVQVWINNTDIITGDTTLTCWVKSINDNFCSLFIGKGAYNMSMTRDVRSLLNNSGYIDIRTSLNSGTRPSTTRITPNTWHFVEVSTEGDTARIFIDGQLKEQKTVTGISSIPWLAGNTFGSASIAGYIGETWQCRCYLYDLCILDGVWHKAGYSVPTAPL